MFQKTIRPTTPQNGRKCLAISMPAPLEQLLVTVEVVSLEKVYFSDTQNPETFC